MPDQTTVKDTEQPETDRWRSNRSVRQSVGYLAHDLIVLLELQAKLLAVDARETYQRLQGPALVIGLGLALAAGACPVALLGFAFWLAEVANFSPAGALFVSAGVGLAVGGLLFVWGWKESRKEFAAMQRSCRELSQNVQWIKNVLKRRGPSNKGEDSYDIFP